MRVTTRILRFAAAGVLLLLAVLGGLFAAGYAVSDLPLLPVVLGIVGWVGVAVVLGWLALRRTDLAVPVLLAATVVVAVISVLDARFDLFTRDSSGPVVTVGILAILVPLALLGVRRSTEAGLMLLLLGTVQLLASGLLHSMAAGAAEWGRLLTGSSGVVVVPVLVASALLLVAGRLAHEHVSFRTTHGGLRTAH